ncbi:MAG: acetyl-CoA carboxylase biotin carboxylase subunit [Deltaproteobacteria bacterium GWA2_57_13]|nr:MAG: acetyl-CoA carboxylase biotin carboxylase subunit [Deltaproteobacteria bacterium GWA2_57_13]OGQ49448.1 MAG: acetyl-CoA carboxylase biotin carboxylase subunit [Deltaproteobacteria bacterium RIFCSPLOWO2_02_FULL_57_26]
MSITRVLVANRGEIAVRIIKACRALGIESVAAVSQADKESLPARTADRAVCIGPPRSADSYLKIESIIAAALGTGSNAVHPGYGFLAEKPELAEACAKHGLTFIGPRPENIRQMGNKLLARAAVSEFGIPVVPGSKKVKNLAEASRIAQEIGFPVLCKAAAGGGGRGIKIVADPKQLREAFETAAAEARAAFGDDTLYFERYIPNARHIEVQVLGDRFGNVIHVGERDCSLQRRYQKVIEEAPAPRLSEALREEIRQAAATVARNLHYENAGTVEFIVDQDRGAFYFLEVNTRIQVEHPVTEMITGIDLVQEQIRIADGQPLSLSQSEVRFSGHAIECRITAESPSHGFRPCPGSIVDWRPPEGPSVRVDSHCFSGYVVPPFYDSLLAKLITRGDDRSEAVERMRLALENFTVRGVDTVIPFLRFLLHHPDYTAGKVNTRWLEAQVEQFSHCA